jgi:hypothetical protein
VIEVDRNPPFLIRILRLRYARTIFDGLACIIVDSWLISPMGCFPSTTREISCIQYYPTGGFFLLQAGGQAGRQTEGILGSASSSRYRTWREHNFKLITVSAYRIMHGCWGDEMDYYLMAW